MNFGSHSKNFSEFRAKSLGYLAWTEAFSNSLSYSAVATGLKTVGGFHSLSFLPLGYWNSVAPSNPLMRTDWWSIWTPLPVNPHKGREKSSACNITELAALLVTLADIRNYFGRICSFKKHYSSYIYWGKHWSGRHCNVINAISSVITANEMRLSHNFPCAVIYKEIISCSGTWGYVNCSTACPWVIVVLLRPRVAISVMPEPPHLYPSFPSLLQAF